MKKLTITKTKMIFITKISLQHSCFRSMHKVDKDWMLFRLFINFTLVGKRQPQLPDTTTRKSKIKKLSADCFFEKIKS